MIPAVALPEAAVDERYVKGWASAVAGSGARRVWLGESTGLSPNLLLALLGREAGLATGLSVALTLLQHPFAAARDARTVAALSGHEHVAAFGPGSADAASALLGSTPRTPVRATARYARTVRELLDGHPVTRSDTDLSMSVGLSPVASPRIEVGLGTLRPAMARAAGEVADVAVTWLAPAAYIESVLVPAIAEGHAVRLDSASCRIVAVVHVALTGSGRQVTAMVDAATAEHAAAPHYADMLSRAGVRYADPASRVRSMIDSGAFLCGTAAEVLVGLAAFVAAGADEVVLNTVGVERTYGRSAAIDDATELLSRRDEWTGGGLPRPVHGDGAT